MASPLSHAYNTRFSPKVSAPQSPETRSRKRKREEEGSPCAVSPARYGVGLANLPQEILSRICSFLPVGDVSLAARTSKVVATSVDAYHTIEHINPLGLRQSLPLFSPRKYRHHIRPWLAKFEGSPEKVMDYLTCYHFFPSALGNKVHTVVKEAEKLKVSQSAFVMDDMPHKLYTSLDGECLLSVSEGTSVKALVAEEGGELKRKSDVTPEGYFPSKVDLSPNGQFVATTSAVTKHQCDVWYRENPEDWVWHKQRAFSCGEQINSVSFGLDNRTIVASTGEDAARHGDVRIVQLGSDRKWHQKASFSTVSGVPRYSVFSPDQKTIAVVTANHIEVWRLGDDGAWQYQQKLSWIGDTPPQTLQWSPDGQSLLSRPVSLGVPQMWEWDKQDDRMKYKGSLLLSSQHNTRGNRAKFNTIGNMLLTMTGNKFEFQQNPSDNPEGERRVNVSVNLDSEITDGCLLPNGRQLALATKDRMVSLWEIKADRGGNHEQDEPEVRDPVVGRSVKRRLMF